MKQIVAVVLVALFLGGCVASNGNGRYIKIIETGGDTVGIPFVDVGVGSVKVETSDEPLRGKVSIFYTGERAVVNAEVGDDTK